MRIEENDDNRAASAEGFKNRRTYFTSIEMG